MPQLFIKHLVCKPWNLTVAVGKKASQFKQNAATGYETSVYTVHYTNLGTWQPGQFSRGGERNVAVPAECTTFYQTSLNCTNLVTWLRQWKRKPASSSEFAAIFYKTSVYRILTLGPGIPTDLVEEEKETGQSRMPQLFIKHLMY
jgi:hypothetical protein